MSLLAVGMSHRSAPLPLLERAALGAADPGFLPAVLADDNVSDAIVIATCNRIEVYADTRRFHGGVVAVARSLATFSGVQLDTLAGVLYAHYDAAAAEHLFAVACGLDSMAVGEAQILGQVRAAWRAAHQSGTPTRELDEVFQQALHVGKRAQHETGLDRMNNAVVEHALDLATQTLGHAPRRIVVVGAGTMSALVVAAVRRRIRGVPDQPPAGVGVGEVSLTIVNRDRSRADRLALGTPTATVARWDALPSLLRTADLVISCTGAVGHVVDGRVVAEARAASGGAPLAMIDLALPRDIDPLAEQVDGVSVVDLARLGADLSAGADRSAAMRPEVDQARAILAEEVARWRGERAAADVAPTVVALRERAALILDGELDRLRKRLPEMSPQVTDEVERAVRRVVDKVLHTPTVRVKQLADSPGGSFYAEALRTLFDLDVSDVASAEQVLGAGSLGTVLMREVLT